MKYPSEAKFCDKRVLWEATYPKHFPIRKNLLITRILRKITSRSLPWAEQKDFDEVRFIEKKITGNAP